MPTFAAIALENLLEPGARDSCKKLPKPNDVATTDGSEEAERREDSTENPRAVGSKHIYISPALYATPEPDLIPGNYSPISSSPSPYVANHKRRCGGESTCRRIESCEVQDLTPRKDGNDLVLEEGAAEEVEDNFSVENEGLKAEYDGEDDFEGFFDPRSERLSVGSFDDFEAKQIECPILDSAQGEFFDANDEFCSSSSSGSSRGFRLEQDLHTTKISLLEEIERRKIAEENLKLMYLQWERISKLMSKAGLTFPSPPTVTDSMQAENNSMDQLSQEVDVARFVAEAVGRGEGRAEAELAANAILELKDQEISRLQDKLLYYETMNHEMSQRNLVEVARRHQQRRRNRPRKWLWSCLGLSISIGASVLAYSYIPSMSKHQPLLDSGDSIDASHISTSSETP